MYYFPEKLSKFILYSATDCGRAPIADTVQLEIMVNTQSSPNMANPSDMYVSNALAGNVYSAKSWKWCTTRLGPCIQIQHLQVVGFWGWRYYFLNLWPLHEQFGVPGLRLQRACQSIQRLNQGRGAEMGSSGASAVSSRVPHHVVPLFCISNQLFFRKHFF